MKKIIFISLFVILLFGLLRYKFDNKIIFDIEKHTILFDKHKYLGSSHVVILGDSRVLNGINPNFFSGEVVNFAFASNSYTDDYLNYIDLNKASKIKTIYIGVSVQSLTSFQESMLFKQSLKDFKTPLLYTVEKVFFHPIPLWDIANVLKKRYIAEANRGYFSLGETVLSSDASNAYKENYQRFKFEPKYLNSLLSKAQKWKNEGIDIIFFLTPSLANDIDFNKELSGISKNELNIKFANAGFNLNEFPETDQLKFVDGDHLTTDSAKIFSKWLASLNQGPQFD